MEHKTKQESIMVQKNDDMYVIINKIQYKFYYNHGGHHSHMLK